MMTILIITNGTLPVPPVKGGAAENLLQTFIDINEEVNDFQLIVFTVSHNKAIDLASSYRNTQFIFIKSETIFYKLGRGIRFIINKLKRNTLKNQFIYEVLKFKKLFKEADLIFLENNPNFAAYIRRITKRPIGLHLHNDYLNIDNKTNSIKILNNIDLVIGVSKYIKNRVIEIAPDNCKVEFVYNGMNLKRFNDIANHFSTLSRNKFGIDADDIVLLFTGRIQKTKGVKLLIEAFIELSDIYKNIKLIIVGGSGFGTNKKSRFIKDLELLCKSVENRIVFTGYIDYSEIHHIYRMADFAIFPSLSTEGFPLTTIEALASGLPVILTDAGGMPETITEKCGFVIKQDDLLKQNLIARMEVLISNQPLRKIMSDEARKRADFFNEKNYCNSLTKYLKSVI